MKKTLLAVLILLASALSASAQQNLLIQTTLAAAVPLPSTSGAVTGGAAPSPAPFGLVQLTSVTSLVAYTLNPTATLNTQQLWVLYIDREEMAVIQLNGTAAYVIRGYNSTVATSHASGAMVLYGKAAWFYNVDPGTVLSQGGGGVSGGTACTTATAFVNIWVNIRTGAQWLCSGQTSTWVPGWNNPMVPGSAITTASVASVAGATLPSGPLFHVTGTNAITSWTVPVGCNATAVGGCSFTIIPDAICTWTAAGNIALAGSCVVNKALTFVWDAKNSKWVPSYIA